MLSHFKIQEQTFEAETEPGLANGFAVVSSPRSYQVSFRHQGHPGAELAKDIQIQKAPLLLIDKSILDIYLKAEPALAAVPTFVVEANEDVKEIATVLHIVDFLEKQRATKASMLFVVGGGILQDLGSFSGAMYKRGLPWTFIPTTLLAQGDSCLGGKSALNYKRTKNLLGLFSAPRRVIIDPGFLETLAPRDILSGAGEIFRLCVTGGQGFLDVFIRELPAFLRGDKAATNRLIATSLSAKKAIVEFDEFELDLRRCMNYGHSFGHALEALTSYKIPHGVGVTLGILVENQISYQRGLLPAESRDLLLGLGKQIIPTESLQYFAKASLDGVIDLLRRDKKAEGTILKLATLERIGQIRFIDFTLDDSGEAELRQAVSHVLNSL